MNVIAAIFWLVTLGVWFWNYVSFLAEKRYPLAAVSAAFALWSAVSAASAVTT